MMRDAINKIDGIGVYLAPQPLVTVLGVKYLHLRVEDGTDLTSDIAPALNQSKLVLAQSVQIQDCQSLLR